MSRSLKARIVHNGSLRHPTKEVFKPLIGSLVEDKAYSGDERPLTAMVSSALLKLERPCLRPLRVEVIAMTENACGDERPRVNPVSPPTGLFCAMA